jgi:outer membrane lipoprotein-sorting protein
MNMSNNSRTAIIMWGAFLCSGAFCQEPAIMKTVRALYSEKTPIETTFDLHILWKVREKEETKSGRLCLAPGDKFRADLGAASWTCNGQTYWEASRDGNDVQVVIKRAADVDLSMHPSQVLHTYLAKFVFRLKERKGGLTKVEWTADSLSETAQTAGIGLSIETKTGIITALHIVDKNGNESDYRFKKTKIPAKLPDNAFDYTIPKGASVLDMRNQ